MKLKSKYILWIVVAHTMFAISSYYSIRQLERPWLILVLELLVLISLMLSIYFYQKFKIPKQFIKFNKQALLEEDFNLQYVKTDNHELNELYDIFNNMLEKIMKERRFAEEQQFFLKDVIEVSPAGIVLLDYDERIEFINPKASSLLGLDETDIGKTISDSKCLIQPLNLSTDKAFTVSLSGAQQLRYTVNSFYFRGFIRKMIMINDLKMELLESEKQSYSKVIRMMAHEINNSIGPINSILNTIKSEYNKDKMIVETIDSAIHRTASLNTFMQNFANVVRLPKPSLVMVDIVPTIQYVIQLMTPKIVKENIQLSTNIIPSLILNIDSYQLEQVLINIIKNSIDAIETNGIIKISLDTKTLIISDNGIGISTQDEQGLFTAFFTTKPKGQGIGLTITKHILAAHNFDFSLSTKDSWTNFKIVF